MTNTVSVEEWFLAQTQNMRVIDAMFKEQGQEATSVLAINQLNYMRGMLNSFEERYVSPDVRARYAVTED